MGDCTHDLLEREDACYADNLCPICLRGQLAEARVLLTRIFDYFGPPQDDDPKNPDDLPCECFICEIQREEGTVALLAATAVPPQSGQSLD